MVAKSAADRLFELSVVVRRAKKDKIEKLTEEAKNRAAEGEVPEKVVIDADAVDAMIYLPDYPQSKAEAFALARAGHSLNGVFEVNEVQKSDADDAYEEEKEAGGSDEDEEDQVSHKSKPISNQEEKAPTSPDSEKT